MDDIAAALEQIESEADSERFRGAEGAYRFQAPDGGSWILAVEDGRVSAHAGAGKADCTIHGDRDDLAGILRGEDDLLITAMQGRIEIGGNLPLAQRLLMALRAGRLTRK